MALNGRILEKEGEFYLKMDRKEAAEAGLRKGRFVELEIRKKGCP